MKDLFTGGFLPPGLGHRSPASIPKGISGAKQSPSEISQGMQRLFAALSPGQVALPNLLHSSETSSYLPEADLLLWKKHLGSAPFKILGNLATESDPEIFFQDLQNFALDGFRNHPGPAEQLVLQTLVEAPDFFGLPIPEGVRANAKRHFDAIQGKGSLGLRIEWGSQPFVDEVLDPGTLLAMGVAAPAYSLTRGLVMERLFVQSANIWNRGLGLRITAGAAGLVPEVLTFSGVHHGYNALMGGAQHSFASSGLMQEWGSLAMTLGLFKMFGYAFGEGGMALQKSHSFKLNPETVQKLSSGLGMYTGVLSSHYLEGKLGWREPQNLSALLLGAGITSLQLKTMGALSHRMMGPRYGAWIKSIEHRVKTLTAPKWQAPWGDFFNGSGFFQPMTPEGIPWVMPMIESREDPKLRGISLMTGSKDGSGNTPGPGLAKAKPLPMNKPNYFKNLLRIYLSKESGETTKVQAAAELYEDPELLESVLTNHFRQSVSQGEDSSKSLSTGGSERAGRAHKLVLIRDRKDQGDQDISVDKQKTTPQRESEIAKKVAEKLINIRMDHLYRLADRLYEYTEKLEFILAKLEGQRDSLPKNDSKEIEKMDLLIHSAEIKHMQISRYYAEAHALIADFKGPKKPSAFDRESYGLHQKRNEGFLQEVETYLNRNSVVREILTEWNGVGPTVSTAPVEFSKLTAHVLKMDIPSEKKDFFQEAITYDPNLYFSEGHSLEIVFKKINSAETSEVSLDLWRPIDRYLESLQQLRRWTTRDDICSISPDISTVDPLGKSGMELTRHQLEKIIESRFSEGSEESRKARGALEDYLDATAKLRTLLSHYVPKMRIPNPLNWEEVKSRFQGLAKHQKMSQAAIDQILNWTEIKTKTPRHAILSVYRNQFVTGMMDFVFNDHRLPEHTRKITDFIERVCQRKDVEMMTNLAIRFHHFSFGELGSERADRDSAPPSQQVIDGSITARNERFLNSLLRMSDFYKAYPEFHGAYFEIIEKLNGEGGEQEKRLVNPIDQRVRDLLDRGYAVDLLSRGGLGTAAIGVKGKGGEKYVLGITSILGSLSDRPTFNLWTSKLLRDLNLESYNFGGDSGSKQLGLAVYVPRFKNTMAKEDAVYWARDTLSDSPHLDFIDLYVPENNSAVRNAFDPKEFLKIHVTKEDATTKTKILDLETKLQESPDDVFLYLELYRHLTSLKTEVDILDPGMSYLISAAHRFPGNKVVASELRKNLESLFKTHHMYREHLLDGFTYQDHRESKVARHKYELDLAWRERRKANPFHLSQSKLGSAEHYRRAEEFLFAVLGKQFSLKNIPEVMDLRATGFEVGNLKWGYDGRNPDHFSLEGEIRAIGDTFPFQRKYRPNKSIIHRSDSDIYSELEAGVFEMKLIKEKATGKIRMEIHRLNIPEAWQMSGMGTLFLKRLISLGRRFDVDHLEYFDVSKSGKIALLKMGGRIKLEGEWERLRRGFPNFVEQYAAKQNWWGVDLSPATTIKNSQDLVFAHIDMLERKLMYTPWYWQNGKNTPTYLDPQYQVGRIYLLEDPGLNWDVVFDLQPGSSSLKTFSHYFSHRFKLPAGQELAEE